MVEELDGMFAGVARPLHKYIQEQGFLGWGCLLVARHQRPEQCASGLKRLSDLLLHDTISSLQTADLHWKEEGKKSH